MNNVIAAFDFDGTLTHHDTLLSFLISISGYPSTLQKIFQLIPIFIQFPFGGMTRQEVKEAVLEKFLKGMPLQEAQKYGERFAETFLDKHLKKEGMEKFRMHKEAGHRCILVSANLDLYLEPWRKRHGFQDLICSCIAYDESKRVTGKLQGLNCWGEEKRRRLIELLGPKENYYLYAYGNSRGDKEMLELADYPYYF